MSAVHRGAVGRDQERPGDDSAGLELHLPPGPTPERVGSYRILGVLGAGGMGVVYEAEQQKPRRLVALKVMHGGHVVDEAHAQLFHREAEFLARLRHPNIAAIYESGHTDDGHDYFAMELATGQTLDEWLRGRPAPFDDDELALRLRVFGVVCEAVHYAHQRGVIHLDLKPSNIMITEDLAEPLEHPAAGRTPTVKILDFGLARVRDTNVEADPPAGDAGAIRGTIAYMAPEQARGEVEAFDVRTDVYALGVMLFEMLSGRRPYRTSGLAMLDALRVVCEESPQPLREVWTGTRRLDADLEAIVATAIEKEPDRRPVSVAALGDDVGRFLRAEPIDARPRTTAYLVEKFVRRHRLGVVVVLLVALCMVGFGVVMTWMYTRSETLRQQLVLAGAEAGRSLRLAEQERDRSQRSEYFAEMTLAGLSAASAEGLSRTIEILGEWYPQVAGVDLRGWEWYYLRARCRGELTTLTAGRGRVRSVAWSRADARIAAANDDGTIAIWDPATARGPVILGGHVGFVAAVAWSPDGARLASAGDDGTIRIRDVATGRVAILLQDDATGIRSLSFSPGGGALAAAGLDGSVRVWEVATGGLRYRLHAGQPDRLLAVAWSPDGSLLASPGATGDLVLVDARTGTPQRSLPARCEPTALAWSPDGARLAAACYDRGVELWDVRSAHRLVVLAGHTDLVHAVAWSHDGTRLATAGFDHTVRIWDASSGRQRSSLGGHVGRVFGVAWSPDDRRIVSSGEDAALKLWDAAAQTAAPRFEGHRESVIAVAYSPDGERAASLDAGGLALVWTVAERRVQLRLESAARSLAWSPDGATIALVGGEGRLEIRDAATGRVAGTMAVPEGTWVDWRPDGARLATAGSDGMVRIFDAAAGDELVTMTGHRRIVNQVAWSPDGRRLASVANDRSVRVWDAATGRQVTEMGHDDYATAVAWSPDGELLASGGNDRTIRIWSAAGGELLFLLRGHSNGIGRVAWSPDGRRLASASVDRTVRIWDPLGGHEALTLGDSARWVTAVSWRPDGRALLAATREPSVRIYDASAGFDLSR